MAEQPGRKFSVNAVHELEVEITIITFVQSILRAAAKHKFGASNLGISDEFFVSVDMGTAIWMLDELMKTPVVIPRDINGDEMQPSKHFTATDMCMGPNRMLEFMLGGVRVRVLPYLTVDGTMENPMPQRSVEHET